MLCGLLHRYINRLQRKVNAIRVMLKPAAAAAAEWGNLFWWEPTAAVTRVLLAVAGISSTHGSISLGLQFSPLVHAVASGFNSMLQCFMGPKCFTCTRAIHMVGRHGVV